MSKELKKGLETKIEVTNIVVSQTNKRMYQQIDCWYEKKEGYKQELILKIKEDGTYSAIVVETKILTEKERKLARIERLKEELKKLEE